MFKLHTPQSITLAEPGNDAPMTLINFRTNGADTSRCVMEIITPDGHMHRLTFTAGGALADQQFIDKDHPEADPSAATPVDYIVGGRDTRADNAYGYQPPVDADTRYRDGQNPGHKSPVAETDEEKDKREQVYAEADKTREKTRKAAEKRHQEATKAAREPDGDLKTSDDTTEKDVSWDAPHEVATQKTFPETTGERDPFDRDSTGQVQANPAGEPWVSPPSSPLPGSPPAHPLDRPDPGVVNTTQTMRGPFDPPPGAQAAYHPGERPNG